MLLAVAMLIAMLPAAVFAQDVKYAEKESVKLGRDALKVDRIDWGRSFGKLGLEYGLEAEGDGEVYTLSGIPENVWLYDGDGNAIEVEGGTAQVAAGSTVIVAPVDGYKIYSFAVFAASGSDADPLIVFTADDVWEDGTGYQMLLDKDANTYGDIIPEEGPMAYGDVSDEVYAEFEYKIPENADGSLNTENVIIDDTVELTIPAGTYDWVITNPTPDDAMWVVGSDGNFASRYDDYVFEKGRTYTFYVHMGNSYDGVDLTVSGEVECQYSVGLYAFVMPEADAVIQAEVGEKIYYNFFDFEDEVTYEDWGIFDGDGDESAWFPFDVAANFGSQYSSYYTVSPDTVMASMRDEENDVDPDNWLFSSEIIVPEESPVLSFWLLGFDSSAPAEKVGVYIMTEEEAESIENLEDMTKLGDFVSSENWEKYYVDLSEYAGKTVCIAFRHYDTVQQYAVFLDDVSIATGEVPDPDIWDFEQASDLNGWAFVDSDNDGYNWYRYMFQMYPEGKYSNSGVGVLTSASYVSGAGALTPDNWAITPAVKIPDKEAALSFYYRGQDPDYAEEVFAVYIGDSQDISTMEPLTADITATGEMQNMTVDLSEYAGTEKYIAFRHYNVTDMFRLNIDDVVILGEFIPSEDVTVITGTSKLDDAYTVDDHVVTVTYNVPCKLGYYDEAQGKYVAITPVKNDDGSYSFTVPEEYDEVVLVVKGDATGDGTVNLGDATRITAVFRQKTTLTAIATFAADINGDGTVNLGDATRITAIFRQKTTISW